jgi:hypothetical protein
MTWKISKIFKLNNITAEIQTDSTNYLFRLTHLDKDGFASSYFNYEDLTSLKTLCEQVEQYISNQLLLETSKQVSKKIKSY